MKYMLVLLLLCPVLVHAQDAAGREVALLTGMQGKVTLRSGGQESSPVLGHRLAGGDELRVLSGNASLVFLSGELVALKDGEALTLGATYEKSMLSIAGTTRGLSNEDGTSVADDGVAAAPAGDVWQAQLASVSGIRGDAMAVAVAPRLAIADPRPVFCWFDSDSTAAGSERNYTLVLRDADGATVLTQPLRGVVGRFNTWKLETPPSAFRAVAGARYSWAVLPAGSAPGESTFDAGFIYVDEQGLKQAAAQRERIAALRGEGAIDEMTMHTLLATFALDERERLFSDAVPHLLALGVWEQGRPYAAEQLARMLLRFGGQATALAPRAASLREDMLPR